MKIALKIFALYYSINTSDLIGYLFCKQDKYTMDPGRQIYLSNNKKKFRQK